MNLGRKSPRFLPIGSKHADEQLSATKNSTFTAITWTAIEVSFSYTATIQLNQYYYLFVSDSTKVHNNAKEQKHTNKFIRHNTKHKHAC